MSTLTENLKRTGAYLISEASDMYRSREQVTIGSGNNLVAGEVLGKITASGKYVRLNPAGADGSQNAAAILFQDAAAASADVRRVVHVRDCIVQDAMLTWPAGITGPQKTAAIAALAANGLIVR